MNHIDEAEFGRACDAIDAFQRQHENDPGITGMVARINLAALRPVYLAMVREFNAGASAGDISKALAAFMSNVVLSAADTITNKEPQARELEINRFLIALGVCIRRGMEDPNPDAQTFVRARPMARA